MVWWSTHWLADWEVCGSSPTLVILFQNLANSQSQIVGLSTMSRRSIGVGKSFRAKWLNYLHTQSKRSSGYEWTSRMEERKEVRWAYLTTIAINIFILCV